MKSFSLRDRLMTTDNPAFIMAIVNATPDSFFEDSRGSIDRALKMIDEGADLLDIGGESTRPGSEYVDEAEEIRRVVPLVREIRKHSDIPISIDTRKLGVMKAAFDEGADMLNDVSALEDDEGMAEFCAETDIPVILMHKRGIPSAMQSDTKYGNVFHEVSDYLDARAEYAISKGIDPSRIIVDPGVGFGKDLDGNIQLIKNCGRLCGGRYPVLMALSRKTCIGQMTGREVDDRLYGTLAADLVSVMNGAFMVRVHDCAPCLDTFAVLKSLQ